MPYYFQKNLQGDVIAITNEHGTVVGAYRYDAWGANVGIITCTELTDGVDIANINPFRYRSYYFDREIEMYYLQSRYYDPQLARFINADEADVGGLDKLVLRWNAWSYCENEPIRRIDINGCYWYQNYSGFVKTNVGFNLYVNMAFLSRTFCLEYAHNFLKANGKWHWYGRTYSGMNQVRIAQELWFHALAYYIGKPIQTVLRAIGVSCSKLDEYVERAGYMEINSNDSYAWIFAAVWWAGLALKAVICKRLRVPYRIIAAIVL